MSNKAIIVELEQKTVILPERIPDALLTVPECPEFDEITWGDARSASDHYRRCKDLRGQRIDDLRAVVVSRWEWLHNQAELIEEDNERLRREIGKGR